MKLKVIGRFKNGNVKECSFPIHKRDSVQIGKYIIPINEIETQLPKIYGLELVEIKGVERGEQEDESIQM